MSATRSRKQSEADEWVLKEAYGGAGEGEGVIVKSRTTNQITAHRIFCRNPRRHCLSAMSSNDGNEAKRSVHIYRTDPQFDTALVADQDNFRAALQEALTDYRENVKTGKRPRGKTCMFPDRPGKLLTCSSVDDKLRVAMITGHHDDENGARVHEDTTLNTYTEDEAANILRVLGDVGEREKRMHVLATRVLRVDPSEFSRREF